MPGFDPAVAARWLAEAMETGSPLGPLPADIAPRDAAAAEEVAAATLDALGIVPCGLRLLRRGGAPALSGPILEGRLVPGGSAVALAALRHAGATAAVVGVLAEKLDPDATTPPVLARLHPAIDLAASRFTDLPGEDPARIADLALLGLVVAGKGKAAAPGTGRVALGPAGSRARGGETDLAAAFAEAAAEARRWGGLPEGALLVVAGLSAPVAPAPGMVLAARIAGLGRAEARLE